MVSTELRKGTIRWRVRTTATSSPCHSKANQREPYVVPFERMAEKATDTGAEEDREIGVAGGVRVAATVDQREPKANGGTDGGALPAVPALYGEFFHVADLHGVFVSVTETEDQKALLKPDDGAGAAVSLRTRHSYQLAHG